MSGTRKTFRGDHWSSSRQNQVSLLLNHAVQTWLYAYGIPRAALSHAPNIPIKAR